LEDNQILNIVGMKRKILSDIPFTVPLDHFYLSRGKLEEPLYELQLPLALRSDASLISVALCSSCTIFFLFSLKVLPFAFCSYHLQYFEVIPIKNSSGQAAVGWRYFSHHGLLATYRHCTTHLSFLILQSEVIQRHYGHRYV
jgi:hypothetical protein